MEFSRAFKSPRAPLLCMKRVIPGNGSVNQKMDKAQNMVTAVSHYSDEKWTR